MPKATELGTPSKVVYSCLERWKIGLFDLDVAASDDLHVCPEYYTINDDGLALPWHGRVWCHPPSGRQEGLWVKKAAEEVNDGLADLVVLLLPAKTGVKWFHDYIVCESHLKCSEVKLRYPCKSLVFLKSRITFLKPDRTPYPTPATFASMVVLFER